ncbi:MAG: primosomal protein N' [Oscillospiraceae bacterium]|nr:primosomal protein N' [Oscillospiraceae bacterium]
MTQGFALQKDEKTQEYSVCFKFSRRICGAKDQGGAEAGINQRLHKKGGVDVIAKIAVSAAVFAIDKPYSYAAPASMAVQPGQRVMAPFGRGNRRTEGIVLAVEEGSAEGLKPIDRVLDDAPVLSDTMLRCAAFLRKRCFCTFYEAVKAMLPAGLWFAVRDTYEMTEAGRDYREAAKRDRNAVAVMERLEALGGTAEYSALRDCVQPEGALQDALRYLLKKKLLTSDTDMLRRVGDKTETILTLAASPEDALDYAQRKQASAPLQSEVLRLLASIGSAGAKEVRYFTGATAQTLRRLETLGYLSFSEREVLRRVDMTDVEPAPALTLNDAQAKIYGDIAARLDRGDCKPSLLYGVTGSGKTSVYIKLIEHCLSKGKSAMLLVPEIALTPQLMRQMVSHFGERVAILHSGLRIGERYDEWKRIRAGDARVVIGTRSAVFAPLCEPGLLILDEEQEHTYKSENTPRYHAREVALWRGVHEKAMVLLGSATPSVESMYHAKNGDHVLYTLPQRYNGKPLPAAQIADLRQELKDGNSGAISSLLLDRLREGNARGEQAILFLNRRGNSRCLVCVDCGEVPQCPRCSVSLTYHSANRRLMCHYCGHSQPVTEICPTCGGHLRPTGVGTQKVEQELHEKLPEAQVLRMDADTVSATNPHEAILRKFREEKIPILLGTQMVAKGLDFPNVTTVGVLDADLALYVDHYRAAETAFSMITQVVGRAGRGSAEGVALIQTMTPQHKVIRLAARQDYDAFYDMEIAIREARRFPPFADLLTVGFSGASEGRVLLGASNFRRWLEASLRRAEYRDLEVEILGPSPAPVVKVNDRFRYRLTVCCRSDPRLRDLTAHLLREFAKDKNNRGVGVYADINPYE